MFDMGCCGCSYFCNTTNLSKGQSSVHEQGTLWALVRASMTIVGMLPPVYYKGDLLVDGGYMNNIPVDVMRSMGVDTVSFYTLAPRPQTSNRERLTL